jgi:cation diffusion facilitator family transporter
MAHGHHHNHAHGLSVAENSEVTRRVTRYAVGVALLLLVLKIYAWRMSDSVSLLASLADSGLDLVASLVTFYAVRYAASPPDARHRFGHGKAEAFASLIQAGLVCASAALVGREAIARLVAPEPLDATRPAIAVMSLSIVLTGLLVAAQSRALRQTGSVAVAGDRLHYATDLLSNLVALAGLVVYVATDIVWADAAAGLFIAVWLLWGAVGVFRGASAQLMDQELANEARERIIALATEDGRIKGVHNLRTRASGPTIHIQMHADLDPQMTLIAAHEAVVAAEKRLLAVFPSADIIIHPDPKGRAEPHGLEELPSAAR